MKIVAISDVHCRHRQIKIPECDILISCGDYSFRGRPEEVKDFHEWMDEQPVSEIISVQGNHELGVEANFEGMKAIAEKACPGVHFIDEGLVEVLGLKIWCSAITPFFCDWAWNRFRGEQIRKHWDKIPMDIDVLVTHGPPHKILDEIYRVDPVMGKNVGCVDLMDKLLKIPTLRCHLFGHIHSGSGYAKFMDKEFYNCSIVDEQYQAAYEPKIIEIDLTVPHNPVT